MNKEEFEEYRSGRYEEQVAWYDSKAKWNHKAFQVSQWTTIILASLTPILIVVGEGWIKWLAAGVAVLVAVSAGALRTFKYQENWINYRTTCEMLKKEIHFFQTGIQGYENVEDKQSLFVKRVEALVSRENTLWLTMHEEKEHTKSR